MNGDDNCIVNRCKCCPRHGRDAVVVLMLTGSFDVSGQASSAVKDCALAMLWRRHELSMEGPGLSNFFDSVRSRIRLCLLL